MIGILIASAANTAAEAVEKVAETAAESGAGEEVSLPSHNLFEIGSFHITNSVLAAFLCTAFIIVLILLARRKAGIIPTKMQSVFEAIITFFLSSLEDAFGTKERARKYLPLFLTFILLIAVANQFSIIPLVMSFKLEGGATLFRVPTSDWSMTIALAIVAIVGSHILALTIKPFKHIGHYFRFQYIWKARKVTDFLNAFLEIFIGILEVIGEFAKIISLSARLFGNIFAGEVMVVMIGAIASFTQFIFPMPFIGLGIFVGFVQAYVFTLLTMQFMGGSIKALYEHH
jgi:F-type H+-transporting ATPase subunit a